MGRKLGSGEGSIWKTEKGWRGQISLNGTRRSVSAKTKKEVADKLAELRVKNMTGTLAARNNITVNEVIDMWIHDKMEPELTEQSLIRLDNYMSKVRGLIGQYHIQDVDKALLEEMYAKIYQSKGVSDRKKYQEKTYSRSTLNALSGKLKRCFSYAVSRGIISENPHNGVELHKLRPPKKVSSHTSADHRKIVDCCKKGQEQHRIFYLLISTGMRFGEAAALTWDDVNLETGEIKIWKTAVSIHGSMTIQEHPKTAAGVRTIFVGDNVREWLQWHKSTLNMEINYRNLVCPNSRGNITNQANAIKLWSRLCNELDIEYMGMHALRHTWATRALEAGVDVKTVSSMLGHKNIITTMNIYQDVLDGQKIKTADALNALF